MTYTPLLYAAYLKNKKIVELLLSKGAKYDINNPEHASALTGVLYDGSYKTIVDAAANNDKYVIEFFLDNNVDVNSIDSNKYTALLAAAHNGHTSTVELLLSKGANIEAKDQSTFTALLAAAHNGHTSTVELLLSKGAKYDINNPEHASALTGVLYDGSYKTIVDAAANNDKYVIEFFLDNNVDVNSIDSNKYTALLAAAHNGHTSTVELLLSKGAKYDINNPEHASALTSVLYDGSYKTIVDAAANNDKYVIEFFLDNNVDVNSIDSNKYTALLAAAHNGHTSTVELLLSKGANIEAKDQSTFTALLAAAHNGHTSTVELLLSKGANIEEEVDDIASFEDIYEDIYEDISIEFKGLEYKEVVSPTTGRIWLDRNLGATQVAQSPDDKKSYGDYYQWGREADGHEKKDSNNFITAKESPYDWSDEAESKRSYFWSKIDGSGICPPGYRVPTIEELELEMKEGNWDNTDDCFNSFLKLPLAGARIGYDASFGLRGSGGYVWSSAVVGSSSWYLHFYSSSVNSYSSDRADGLSVRCIKGE